MVRPIMRVRISMGDHDFVTAEDEETQRALWLLIENRLSIGRVAAEALLAEGKLLIGKDFIACRQDTLEAIDSAIDSRESPQERPANG
jgi:hypothetical protein